ncbi:MAG: hypothetical protein M1825_002780 [Sarcosagium campestre]|nr:MAG: hypothetical protein M1825_002780 [Sarcosagium campestre]
MSARRSVFADPRAVRRALEILRNSENGSADPAAKELAEAALAEVWGRIRNQPDSYVLTSVEFAVFNFYRETYRYDAVAQAAIQRFWDSYQGSSGSVDGP